MVCRYMHVGGQVGVGVTALGNGKRPKLKVMESSKGTPAVGKTGCELLRGMFDRQGQIPSSLTANCRDSVLKDDSLMAADAGWHVLLSSMS